MNGASAKPPVIIGAGFAGLLISHRLARYGIPHLLIGKTPDFRALRVGESLDFAGTWLLKENFGHLGRFFYRKDQVFALGTEGQVINFKTDQFLADPVPGDLFLRIGMGLRLSDLRLIHLDRQGFDHALYEEVMASPCVERREAEVEAVEYDPGSDRVIALKLEGGERIEPSVVFDATFNRRLIAEAARVPVQWLSGPRVATFTHLHAVDKDKEPSEDWEVSTTVMNLGRGLLALGVEGQGWCIPFRNHVSVGLSMLPMESPPEAEHLIGLLLNAFGERGIPVAERFPQMGLVSTIRHRYFTHAKAAGANWLLAGGACTQIHFFSSTGVTTALAAAEVAPDFVKDSRAARRYQGFLEGLASGHRIFAEIEERGQRGELCAPLVKRWVHSVFLRTWGCLKTASSLRRRLVASFYYRLFSSELYYMFEQRAAHYYSLSTTRRAENQKSPLARDERLRWQSG